MAEWIELCGVDDCPLGESREFVAGDRIVALFNADGAFFALDGVCAHQGGPLGKGALQGCVVTCPWHGWQYDVRTGQHGTAQSVVQASFPTKVEEGRVWVDLAGN